MIQRHIQRDREKESEIEESYGDKRRQNDYETIQIHKHYKFYSVDFICFARNMISLVPQFGHNVQMFHLHTMSHYNQNDFSRHV